MAEMRRFIGGMNVPVRGGWGRMNATVPLAELTIDDQWVTLRPRFFAALLSGPFQLPLTAIAVAYPLRSKTLASGIGLSTTDEQTAYFWTWRDKDDVLRGLADRGIAVDASPRPASAVRGLRSPRTAQNKGAPINPWMIRLLPFSLVAAVSSRSFLRDPPGLDGGKPGSPSSG